MRTGSNWASKRFAAISNIFTKKCTSAREPKPWRDNDPEYPEPVVTSVKDITDLRLLNDRPLDGTRFVDTQVDLTRRPPESGDYGLAVYAYVVRAVNRLGTESGPSPYALTIPSAPTNVLLREAGRLAAAATRGTAPLRTTFLSSFAAGDAWPRCLDELRNARFDAAGQARACDAALEAFHAAEAAMIQARNTLHAA